MALKKGIPYAQSILLFMLFFVVNNKIAKAEKESESKDNMQVWLETSLKRISSLGVQLLMY